MSVSSDILIGCPSLPTTNNSLSSLNKPTVVTYGLKREPVAKFARSAFWSDLIFLVEILCVKLYSSAFTVHWYSFSYMGWIFLNLVV